MLGGTLRVVLMIAALALAGCQGLYVGGDAGGHGQLPADTHAKPTAS